MTRGKRVGVGVVFAWFLIGGIAHFVFTEAEMRIVPPWMPWPRAAVLASGGLELLGAGGLLFDRTRRAAGVGLVLLTIAVTPAHVYMLQHPELFGVSLWMLWLRLPIQAALLALVVWATARTRLTVRQAALRDDPVCSVERERSADEIRRKDAMSEERAVLAGGCFWGMQDLIRKRDGVISTRVGYSGGDVPNATYRRHGTHAEAIEIVFDPSRLSYREVLEFFFQIHDPTTRNRQGNDVGLSYRSAIFYTSEAQKRIARDTITDVEASGLWPGNVETEVAAAGPFWEAEPEHQDYLERLPDGYTCHFIRPGWKLPVRAASASR